MGELSPKEYLRQAFVIDRRIKITKRKLEEIRSIAEYKSPQTDGSGGGSSSGNSKEEIVCKILAYEEKCNKLISLLIDKRLEIEKAIEAVEEPTQREILERRYLLYENWEGRIDKDTGEYINGIAEDMGITKRWAVKVHGEALKKIKVPKE
jgi:hypothetical protein